MRLTNNLFSAVMTNTKIMETPPPISLNRFCTGCRVLLNDYRLKDSNVDLFLVSADAKCLISGVFLPCLNTPNRNHVQKCATQFYFRKRS